MPAVVRAGRRQAAPDKQKAEKKSADQSHAPKSKEKHDGQLAKTATKSARPSKGRIIANRPAIGVLPVRPDQMVAMILFALLSLLSLWLLTGNRAQIFTRQAVLSLDQQLAAFGFKIDEISYVNAADKTKSVSEKALPDIKKAVRLKVGDAFVFSDLKAIKDRLSKVGWVREATVSRQLPNRLIITIVERPTLAVWHHNNKHHVIDDTGFIIKEANPKAHSFLPMVSGPKANEKAAEILMILNSKRYITDRLDALIRIDTRRWDLRLKNGIIIKLPATNEAQALDRLENLHQQTGFLDRKVESITLYDHSAIPVTGYRNEAYSEQDQAFTPPPPPLPPKHLEQR